MKFSIPGILLILSYLFAGSTSVEVVGPPCILTGEEDYFISPRWSPDGTMLAVSGQNYNGIYLVTFPGGEVIPLADDLAAGVGVQWSSGGDKILSVVSRYENRRRYDAVAVFDVISGKRKLLTDFKTGLRGVPRWSSDGHHVYLVGSKDIALLDSGHPALPREKIVASHRDEISVYDLPQRKRTAFEAVEGEKLNLTLSPDGKKVAFEIMGGNLWVTNIDGTDAVDLGVGYRPSWAPGGNKIAYMITTDDGHQYLSSDVYVINVDGSGKVNVTNTETRLEMSPCWSPDGKWIAYHTLNEGQILVQEVR